MENFWDNNEYAMENYISPEPVTEELIQKIENEFGYKLPTSYINLMKIQNGGMPIKNCYPTTYNVGWGDNHVAIEGIYGLGYEKDYSIGLAQNSAIEDWGYPNIGLYFGDTPTAGHTMFALSYLNCTKDGEPEVVHVEQEKDYKISVIAPDFQTFINGLVTEDSFEEK